MKPSAEINAEVRMPSGEVIRWDSGALDLGSRPLAPSLESVSGRGFGSGSVVLRRPTDRDYPELGLLNELTLRTGSGTIVYQGRAQGIPVADEWQFDCDGWASHGEQREILDIILDRDISAWSGLSNSQRARLTGLGYREFADPTADGGLFRLELNRLAQAGATGSVAGATYRSPVPVGQVSLAYSQTASLSSNWRFRSYLHAGSDAATELSGTNVDGPTSGMVTLSPGTSTAQYATALWFYRTGITQDGSWVISVTPTVTGRHNVPLSDRGDGLSGFTASDAIRYLASTYCPKWDLSGVEDTTYLIPHAAWRSPVAPLDAIRQLNSYHLWRLGVWEDRRLEFAPYDLSVADWQVQAGVDGVQVSYQGDTTENVFNGVAVSFTDFSGESQRVTPADAEALRDTSDWIAANQWGDEAWLSIEVSWPCSQDDAVEIGAVALANANQARRPSTITVPMHIQDIHGSWWPSSMVRADQTILVTNQHAAVPRLITRASWSNHQLTLTCDNAVDTMEAFNQRVAGALSARGLT